MSPQIDIPSWQKQDQTCERCGKSIQWDTITWLDYRTSDGTYHIPGAVMTWNDPDNQGAFPFGAKCAEYVLKHGVDW